MPGPGHYNPAINTVGHEPHGALTTKFQGRAKNVQGKFLALFKILIYNLILPISLLIIAEPAVIMQKQNVPGPGHYGAPMSTASNGNYVLSTIPNTKHGRISPTKRFVDVALKPKA